jgi:hypothetical protein
MSTLILQRVPTTLFVVGSSQILALCVALPVGIYAATRPYSIFDQIANTLAFIGFSLPTFFTGLLFILLFSVTLDWLPLRLSFRRRGDGLALVLGDVPPGDHADHGARPVPGGLLHALCALGRARRHPARLRHHGAPRASASAGHIARHAQRADPGRDAGGAADAGRVRRRHRHRADLPHPGHRLAADRRHPGQRHPGDHGGDLVFACLVVPSTSSRDVLYGWLDPRIAFADPAVAERARHRRHVSPGRDAWRRFRRHRWPWRAPSC